MRNLEARVIALESKNRVARRIIEAGVLSDEGPYDADALTKLWDTEGRFNTGSSEFNGRSEIHNFYASLAQSYTIHFFTNILVELDPPNEEANAACYVFEGPIIDSEALFGGFEHSIRCRSTEVDEVWISRDQTVHFLAPFLRGWEGESVVEQDRGVRAKREQRE